MFRGFSRGILAGRTGLGELLVRVSDLCDALRLQLRPARPASSASERRAA